MIWSTRHQEHTACYSRITMNTVTVLLQIPPKSSSKKCFRRWMYVLVLPPYKVNLELFLKIIWDRQHHFAVEDLNPSSEDKEWNVAQWYGGFLDWSHLPLSYFSFQPVLYNWYTKGHGIYYPVCGMVHIKYPLLLIRKSSPWRGSSEFSLSLFEFSLTT